MSWNNKQLAVDVCWVEFFSHFLWQKKERKQRKRAHARLRNERQRSEERQQRRAPKRAHAARGDNFDLSRSVLIYGALLF